MWYIKPGHRYMFHNGSGWRWAEAKAKVLLNGKPEVGGSLDYRCTRQSDGAAVDVQQESIDREDP